MTYCEMSMRIRVLVSCPRGSRNNWRGLKVERALGKPRDAFENLIGGLDPDERFRVRMMRVNEFTNRRLQLCDAAVNPSPKLFVGQLGKPAFDQIQPRSVSRREMDMKARPLGEPVSDQGGCG